MHGPREREGRCNLMDTQRCAAVQLWMQETLRSRHPLLPDPALTAHIAVCDRCRGALLLLAYAALGGDATAIDCARCAEDLPAWIEAEQDDPVRALRSYPAVWLHLLTCPACAELYRLSRLLVDAQQEGRIALPQLIPLTPAAPPRRQRLVALTRPFLNHALPTPLALIGVTRGSTGPVILLDGDAESGKQIVFSVQEQPDQRWLVVVHVTPPVAGWLVLSLGASSFRARFDDQGHAMVTDIPTELLAAHDGPDLEIGFEQDDAP
jgi:predicted anti-sigma-YlaC factor YlaD